MFEAAKYGDEVARILALDGDGGRLMPLTIGKAHAEAQRMIRMAKIPDLLRAGLFFYFNCWNEAHEIAQNIETTDGSYWHALVHRQEPDASNSGYWFHRMGSHPIFPALRELALAHDINFGPKWDPLKFVEYCGKTTQGSEEERKAKQVQLVEWQLLFDHCAR